MVPAMARRMSGKSRPGVPSVFTRPSTIGSPVGGARSGKTTFGSSAGAGAVVSDPASLDSVGSVGSVVVSAVGSLAVGSLAAGAVAALVSAVVTPAVTAGAFEPPSSSPPQATAIIANATAVAPARIVLPRPAERLATAPIETPSLVVHGLAATTCRPTCDQSMGRRTTSGERPCSTSGIAGR